MQTKIIQKMARSAGKIALLLVIILILPGFSKKAEPLDLGIDEFNKTNYSTKLIAVANIRELTLKAYSERFKQVEKLNLDLVKILNPASFKKSAINCEIISDLKMIAPFEKQTLDQTLNLKKGEKLLVYLGLNKDKCEIVHISKVDGEQIHFPAYKSQPEKVLNITEFEKIANK